MKNENRTRLLSRGTSVLTAIGQSREPLSFKEIQESTQLSKATLSRILSTLRSEGFLRLEPNGRRYTLGRQILDLAAAAQTDLISRRIFRTEVQRLADALERRVWHWAVEGEHLLPSELVLPFGMESFTDDTEKTAMPMNALDRSAVGIALLAAMPPDRIATMLGGLDTANRKESDISLRLGFSAATGFAVHELGDGQIEIAAAITDAVGLPVAALSVFSISDEETDSEIQQIGRQLSAAVQKISSGPNPGPRKLDVQSLSPLPPAVNLDVRTELVDNVGTPDKVGTSPYWDAKYRRVVWGDSLGGGINWIDANGEHSRLPFAALPGAVVPFVGGKSIVASRDGLSIVDYKNNRHVALSHPEPEEALRRFSVAKIGPDGRIWFGTLQPVTAEGAANGRLYAFGRDGKVEKILDLQRGAKGLGWSPNGNYLYVTEAGSRTILRFEMDPNTGRAINPRRFARHMGPGTPNGIAVDSDGCVWAAIYGGWRIQRFDPNGSLIGSIDLPVPLPTGLCFCGPGLRYLFVTNCRLHVPPDVLDEAKHAGLPLRIEVDASGLPEVAFKLE